MTKERAKELLPIIQAFADGKAVQYKTGPGPLREWITATDSSCQEMRFDERDFEFRIKPEPKLRPWRPEEVPPGAVLRRKDTPNEWCIATACIGGAVKMGILTWPGDKEFDFKDHHLTCEHSTDNGKTWLPCGILE